jgi:hypothetical protein
MTHLQPRPQLAWNRSHGEPADAETLTFPIHHADPPPDTGGSGFSAGDDAVVGGDDGFSLQRSAWDVLSGQGLMLADLREYLEDCDENPALRAAATLRAMDRLRDALHAIPEDADLEQPITLALMDAALLARQLLSRLR